MALTCTPRNHVELKSEKNQERQKSPCSVFKIKTIGLLIPSSYQEWETHGHTFQTADQNRQSYCLCQFLTSPFWNKEINILDILYCNLTVHCTQWNSLIIFSKGLPCHCPPDRFFIVSGNNNHIAFRLLGNEVQHNLQTSIITTQVAQKCSQLNTVVPESIYTVPIKVLLYIILFLH